MAAMGLMFGKKGGFKGGFGAIRKAAAGTKMGAAIKGSRAYSMIGGKLPSMAKVGFLAGGAFLGTSGVLGAFSEGGGASNVLSGAMGGAMIGGALGGPVGAAIGGALGGGAAFAAGLFGKNKKQNASKSALDQLEGSDMFSTGPNAQFETRSAKFDHDTQLMQLYNDALEAGGHDGDTEAAAKFIRAMGLNPDDIHRDDFMEGLRDKGFGGDLESTIKGMKNTELKNEVDMIKRVNDSLSKFGDELEISGTDVRDFVESVGLNLMDASERQLRAAGMMMAADRLNFSRNQAIIPDIGNSGLAVGEKAASANAALNAIISGDMTSATITDFLTKQAQLEVSLGNSVDVAGLSGIMELRAQAEAGRFGAEGSANYKSIMGVIDTGEKNFFRDLAGQTMIGQSELEGVFAQGGMGGLDSYVGQIQQNRAAISGTGGMSFNDRLLKLKDLGFKMDKETFDQFREDAGLGVAFNGGGPGLFEDIIAAAERAGTDEETLSNALSQAFIDSGLSVDQMEGVRNAIENLPDHLQKLSITMNDGSDGGDQSITARGSAGEFAYLNLGPRQGTPQYNNNIAGRRY
jgi:hypothetical protein